MYTSTIGSRELNQTEERHAALIAKIVAMVVLLVGTIICGGIPFLLNRWFNLTANKPHSRSTRFINFLLQLSGGVILATTFLHLLPEVQEIVEHLVACEKLKELPFALPETLMCGGFFLIYLVEALIGLVIHKRAKKAELLKHVDEAATEACSNQQDCSAESTASTESLTTPRSLSGLLIVVALSLHEIFEGMAIGLESNSSSVWILFGAVSGHKLVLAFCLGIELLVERTSNVLCIIYMGIFALITPIGIGIGILLSHYDVVTTSSLPAAILQGIACGALLYVVFFEILNKCHASLTALLAIFIGFAFMFGLKMLDHDDDEGEHIC